MITLTKFYIFNLACFSCVILGSQMICKNQTCLNEELNEYGSQDIATVKAFFDSYITYRAVVDGNCLQHMETYSSLQRALQQHFADTAFSFMDLGCGDASKTSEILQSFKVSRYIGIDLSNVSLAMARKNVKKLKCPVDIFEGDFSIEIKAYKEPIDVIFIGLSLHHLRRWEKLTFFKAALRILSTNGKLILWEPTFSQNNQTRDDYHDDRDKDMRELCPFLSNDQMAGVMDHMRSSDYPEDPDTFASLAIEAGFKTYKWLYQPPSRHFTLMQFDP